MLKLRIIAPKKEPLEHTLTPNQTYIIGRGPDGCQIVINDDKVSKRHAEIVVGDDLSVTIKDLGSTNGTKVNNKSALEQTVVNTKSSITVGLTTLLLVDMKNDADMPRIMIADNKHESPKDDGETEQFGSSTRAIQIDRSTINIGRDSSNDIVLEHPMASRKHATITKDAENYTLTDHNSTNGTYLNGKKIEKGVVLKPADLIHICGYRYLFDGQKLEEYNENTGQLNIDLHRLQKTIKTAEGVSKNLLDDISLSIKPNEFVAILGGSGAGKTTLLGSLTGMNPATSGEITINGRNFYREYNSFRSMLGYVPQQDIVHDELTVWEVLTYAGKLRMPEDTTDLEIAMNAEQVLFNLDLSEQRHVLVRNLSGGQKKRVSIGVELLTKPSIFFLDEPTSGLDPGLEYNMMEMLRKLANQGRTVILVTHATFNIKLCDKVIFLAEGGRLAFYGTPEEALTYFEVDDYAQIYKKIASEKTSTEWADSYYSSEIGKKYKPKKQQMSNESGTDNMDSTSITNKTSSFRQWWILTSRYNQIIARDKKNITLLFLQPIIIALLILITYYHVSPVFEDSKYRPVDLEITERVIASGNIEVVLERQQDEATRRNDMSSAVAIMVFSAIWLGASNSAREIIKEQAIYKRERLVNLKLIPYLLSKIVPLSFISLLQSALFLFIIFVGLGLPLFWLNVGAFFLIFIASVMMGLMISALVNNTNNATAAVPLILIPQIILSGAIMPVEYIRPELLQSVFYLAISKWGYELMGGEILNINNRSALETPIKALSGDLSGHWLVLLGFVLLFFAVSIFALWKKDNKLS